MGKLSKELFEKSGKVLKLRLGEKTKNGAVSTGRHIVKLITEKESERLNQRTNKIEKTVKYLFEENGVRKYYETPLLNKKDEISYLVERMADVKEGDTVILEMDRVGTKNYIRVNSVLNAPKVEIDEDDEELEDEDLDEPKE